LAIPAAKALPAVTNKAAAAAIFKTFIWILLK
jgi:hypothetical protein